MRPDERTKPKSNEAISRSNGVDSTSLNARDQTALEQGRHTEWLAGYSFDRYQVIRTVGKGISAIVYLAEDRRLHRQVAIKVARNAVDQSETSNERFFREAESVARLQHPNICQVYDLGIHEGHFYIAMSYIDGRPLSEWLENENASEYQIACIVRSLALALEEAHEQGVIHRDLKPANVLMNKRGEPILTDFGLALTSSRGLSARLTQPGLIVGSPAYMSPEQIRDASDVGPCSDVYSLGVVMYQMICDALPFTGEIMTVIRKIALDEPRPPSSHCPGLSAAMDGICLKAMQKDPSKRFASMSEFADALSEVIEHTPHPKQRSAIWLGLAALIAFVAMGIAAFTFLPDGRPVDSSQEQASAEVERQTDRLARLNALLENGIRIQLEGDRLLAPVTEIPASVLCVSAQGYPEFDYAQLRELLEVVPSFRRLDVRTDNFSPEAWELLLQSHPTELSIEADELTTQQWQIIGQMRDLIWLEVVCPTIDDEQLAPLASLVNVQSLTLAEFAENIDGSCFQHLSSLKNLYELDLSGTRFQDQYLPDLLNFPRLEILSLAGTPITAKGLTSLAKIPRLRILDLGSTSLSNADLASLAEFPALTDLSIEHCPNISDLSNLRGRPIRRLEFSGTSVTDLRPLLTMPIEEIYFDQSDVKDHSILRSLTKLRSVNGTPADAPWPPSDSLPDTEPSRLERMNALGKLGVRFELDQYQTSQQPLKEVPDSIWGIEASSFEIRDDQLKELLEIAPPYERLEIRADAVTTEGWNLLLKNQPEWLSVKANHLAPEYLRVIGQMRKIERLTLSCPNLRDADVEAISGLSNLTFLDLSFCKVNGACLQYLGKMNRLESLDLVQTLVHDESLAKMPVLPALKVLSLAGSQVEGSSLASLSQLPELFYLNLAQTAVTNEAIVQLKQLPKLKELVLLEVTQVTDVSALADTAIENLYIVNTPIENLSPLRSMKLTHLRLDESRLTDRAFEFLPPTLESLNLRPAQEFLNELRQSRLARLNALSEKGVRLNKGSQESLPVPLTEVPESVWGLVCDYPEFDAETLRELLAVAPKYKRLMVNADKLTAASWKLILEDRPQQLFIDGSQRIPKEHWQIIGKMRGIKEMEISCPRLVDEDLQALKALEDLTFLALPGCESIDGSGLKYLARMHKLRTLDLVNTGIRDECLRELPPLRSLISLGLRQTPIDGSGLADLGRLPVLNTLHLGGTSISNDNLSGLKNLRHLAILHLDDCTKITELTPLIGSSVTSLSLRRTPVTDLRPVGEMRVLHLTIDEELVDSAHAIGAGSALKSVNGKRFGIDHEATRLDAGDQ